MTSPTPTAPKTCRSLLPASASNGDTLRVARVRSRAGMGMDLTSYTEDEMLDVRAHYAGLVKQIDHEVGEIVDALRRNGLLDSTVIVFATDHGDHLGDHGIEGKATFYESAAHIPLLVRAPGRTRRAPPAQDLVELRDVTATMLALAGCALPDYMDAQLLPALGLEGPSPRDHPLWLPHPVVDGLRRTLQAGQVQRARRIRRGSPLRPPRRPARAEITCSPRPAQRSTWSTAAWTPLSRGELMSSMAFSMHDRLPRPYSMSGDEHEAREGWIWPYPSPASAAVQVEDPY